MHIGVFYFATEYSMPIVELGKELEERGFESLFQPEHTHIPTSRKSPYPGGGELPKEYKHTYDPFVSLSFVAAATKKLKVGTGICLLAQRDPIVTAKCVSSIDALSGGDRFVLGIGGGWNVDEMEHHGTTYKTRFARMRDNVLAMKAAWTQEEAEYHGEYARFEKSWFYPKPVTRPHPPILIGGETDYTLRRIVEYADGWFPRPRGAFDPVIGMQRMRQMAAEADRDPDELSMSVFRAPNDRKAIDGYEEAGIERAILPLPTEGRDVILPLLDSYMPLLD